MLMQLLRRLDDCIAYVGANPQYAGEGACMLRAGFLAAPEGSARFLASPEGSARPAWPTWARALL